MIKEYHSRSNLYGIGYYTIKEYTDDDMMNEFKLLAGDDFFKRRRNYTEKKFLEENQSIVKISVDNYTYATYFKYVLPNGKYIYRINIGRKVFKTNCTFRTDFRQELLKYDLKHGEDNSFYKDVLAKIADNNNTLYAVSANNYKVTEFEFEKVDLINPSSVDTQADSFLSIRCKHTWGIYYMSIAGCIDNTIFTYNPGICSQSAMRVKLSGCSSSTYLYKMFTRKEDTEDEIKRLLAIERERRIREIGNKRRSIIKTQKRISEIDNILNQ